MSEFNIFSRSEEYQKQYVSVESVGGLAQYKGAELYFLFGIMENKKQMQQKYPMKTWHDNSSNSTTGRGYSPLSISLPFFAVGVLPMMAGGWRGPSARTESSSTSRWVTLTVTPLTQSLWSWWLLANSYHYWITSVNICSPMPFLGVFGKQQTSEL